MGDLRLDSAGDLLIEGFDLGITDDGSETTAQRLRIKLQFFKGEWFLNLGFGVPWFQEILKKNVSQSLVDSILKDQIINTEGVIQLTSYSSEYDNTVRGYVVNFTVTSSEGEIIEITEII